MSTILHRHTSDALYRDPSNLQEARGYGGDGFRKSRVPMHPFSLLPSAISWPSMPRPREDSTSTQSSRLPALAALASIAARSSPMAEAVEPTPQLESKEFQTPKEATSLGRKRKQSLFSSDRVVDMSYATVAPGQATAFANGAPPVCANCQTSTTPLWRRDEDGNVLCNACGLFLKLHGRARPISLKTNIIKSRNRVKAPGTTGQQGSQTKKKKPSAEASGEADSTSATALSDHQKGPQEDQQNGDADSPANIAPQHMFDSITLDPANQHCLANLYTPSYAPQRNGSPNESTLLNGLSDYTSGPNETSQPSGDLVASNNHLKTRVSELEVINNLFRERVAELEGGEAETKQALENAQQRIKDLEARVAELERGSPNEESMDTDHEAKRRRVSLAEDDTEERVAAALSNSLAAAVGQDLV